MAAKKKKNENSGFGVLKFFVISFAVLIFGGTVLLLAIIVERGASKIEEVNEVSKRAVVTPHPPVQMQQYPKYHQFQECKGRDVTVNKEKSVKGFFADKRHVFLYLEGQGDEEKIVTINFCSGKIVSTITLE